MSKLILNIYERSQQFFREKGKTWIEPQYNSGICLVSYIQKNGSNLLLGAETFYKLKRKHHSQENTTGKPT